MTDPRSKTRVLVFPSVNEPGLEIIDALRKHPRIELWGGSSFAVSTDPSRLLLGARHHLLPALGDPGFRESFTAHCTRHAIHFVFPTMDVVVAELTTWRDTPFRVIGPPPETAARALSKSAIYSRVADVVAVPRGVDDAAPVFPVFAKPEQGSGSRGARRIDSIEALRAARAEGLLVQEYLPGDEWTVDCVSTPDGGLIAVSPRRRTSIGGGIALAAECVEAPELEAAVRRIAERVPMGGPWFAQFRADREGVPRLLEVNVRVGGSMGVSRLAGVNIPLLALLSFQGVAVRGPRRMIGVQVIRRLDRRGEVSDFDAVIWDLDDTLVSLDGRVDTEAVALLYAFRERGVRQFLVSRNPDPGRVVREALLPPVFEEVIRTDDKVAAVRALLERHGLVPARVISINDSGSERLLFEDAFPEIRTIGPDAIGVLA